MAQAKCWFCNEMVNLPEGMVVPDDGVEVEEMIWINEGKCLVVRSVMTMPFCKEHAKSKIVTEQVGKGKAATKRSR